VLELSSYQIDLTHSLDCDVAALLNITPDHLDRYDGFEGYAASKARLFAMQRPDSAVFGTGDAETAGHRRRIQLPPRKVSCSVRSMVADVVASSALAFAARAAQPPERRRGASRSSRRWASDAKRMERGACQTFRAAAPHGARGEAQRRAVHQRQQGDQPASTAPALAAFPPDPDPRIHWIVGGLPKGDNLDECAPWFGNVAAAYTIGDAGPMFADLLAPHMPVHAQRDDGRGDPPRRSRRRGPAMWCMLSPACASFDQFRDYEARGDAFRQIVEALTECEDRRRRALMARGIPPPHRARGIAVRRAAPRYRKRNRRGDFAIWWREIDRVLLSLVLILMAIGHGGGRRGIAGQRAAPVDGSPMRLATTFLVAAPALAGLGWSR
jgi:UDP-N-acetylmuramoylalanine--D-glutamate ligase